MKKITCLAVLTCLVIAGLVYAETYNDGKRAVTIPPAAPADLSTWAENDANTNVNLAGFIISNGTYQGDGSGLTNLPVSAVTTNTLQQVLDTGNFATNEIEVVAIRTALVAPTSTVAAAAQNLIIEAGGTSGGNDPATLFLKAGTNAAGLGQRLGDIQIHATNVVFTNVGSGITLLVNTSRITYGSIDDWNDTILIALTSGIQNVSDVLGQGSSATGSINLTGTYAGRTLDVDVISFPGGTITNVITTAALLDAGDLVTLSNRMDAAETTNTAQWSAINGALGTQTTQQASINTLNNSYANTSNELNTLEAGFAVVSNRVDGLTNGFARKTLVIHSSDNAPAMAVNGGWETWDYRDDQNTYTWMHDSWPTNGDTSFNPTIIFSAKNNTLAAGTGVVEWVLTTSYVGVGELTTNQVVSTQTNMVGVGNVVDQRSTFEFTLDATTLAIGDVLQMQLERPGLASAADNFAGRIGVMEEAELVFRKQ